MMGSLVSSVRALSRRMKHIPFPVCQKPTRPVSGILVSFLIIFGFNILDSDVHKNCFLMEVISLN